LQDVIKVDQVVHQTQPESVSSGRDS
jgi:hypothetical protein